MSRVSKGTVVLKVGGSILTRARAYGRVAAYAYLKRRIETKPEEKLVVAVSAQKLATNVLERSARRIVRSPSPRALDLFWSTGELRSVATSHGAVPRGSGGTDPAAHPRRAGSRARARRSEPFPSARRGCDDRSAHRQPQVRHERGALGRVALNISPLVSNFSAFAQDNFRSTYNNRTRPTLNKV